MSRNTPKIDGAHFTKMTETVSQHSIPRAILDDLGSRFIINIPEEERKDLIRICFQIELAHWFYVDEYVEGEDTILNSECITSDNFGVVV